ncbi:hypothetical protein KRM28CT15_00980 [Krasilnikovia sp. M28-CT-15]
MAPTQDRPAGPTRPDEHRQWVTVAQFAMSQAALVAPNTLALIASTFPAGTPRNKAMAVYSAMSALGTTGGVLLGGLLTSPTKPLRNSPDWSRRCVFQGAGSGSDSQGPGRPGAVSPQPAKSAQRGGSFTMLTKNSSIWRITAMNCSKSTGLVTYALACSW